MSETLGEQCESEHFQFETDESEFYFLATKFPRPFSAANFRGQFSAILIIHICRNTFIFAEFYSFNFGHL